jgi:hypothetical protein
VRRVYQEFLEWLVTLGLLALVVLLVLMVYRACQAQQVRQDYKALRGDHSYLLERAHRPVFSIVLLGEH